MFLKAKTLKEKAIYHIEVSGGEYLVIKEENKEITEIGKYKTFRAARKALKENENQNEECPLLSIPR